MLDPAAFFKVLQRSSRVDLSAGISPKINPVSSVRPMLNSRIRQSGFALSVNEALPTGTTLNRPFVVHTANRIPIVPPAAARTRLSTSNWRTSWLCEAPTDSRTAISFCRATARAINRLATFAQAISSTSPTMHIRTTSAFEKLLRSWE